jgi:predicted phosphodiesterase
MPGSKWTPEEDVRLKELAKTNLGLEELARILNRSQTAVKLRLKRLNLQSKKNNNELTPTFSEVIEKILGQIKSVPLEKLETVKAPEIHAGEGDEEQALLHLTDIHIGRKTESFNSNVARDRMIYLVSKVLKIISLHRVAGPIKVLNVFLTGDIINSEDVGYRVDLSELEFILRDQIFGEQGAVALLTWTFKSFLENFEQVNVYAVRGNHGRGPKGSSEKTNWDDVVYHVLKVKFEDNSRIRFYIADSFYQIVKIYNKRFLIAHGDQVRGGTYGIPLYSLLQRMLRWATAMPEPWEYFFCGHWHTIAEIEQNGQVLYVGGTFVSDDEYTLRQYGWNACTKQVLAFVHPQQGITARYKINLLNAKKIVKQNGNHD